MDGDALDRLAERARQRYALLLGGFRDALARLSAEHPPGSERARQALHAELYRLASAWLEEEGGQVEAAVRAAGADGVAATDAAIGVVAGAGEVSEAVAEHLGWLAGELDAQLRLQIERDVALVMRGLRDMALGDALRERLGRAPGGAAGRRGMGGSGARDDALSRVVFEFVDRSGRRWPSPKHVRALWRQALVLAWNEAAMLRMAEAGIEEAVVDHPDPNHGDSGLVVGLLGQPDRHAWDDIRAGVFHPNSKAFLRPPDGALADRQSAVI